MSALRRRSLLNHQWLVLARTTYQLPLARVSVSVRSWACQHIRAEVLSRPEARRDAVPSLRMLDGLFVGLAEKHIAIANTAMANISRRRRTEFAPVFRTLEAKGRFAVAYRQLRFHLGTEPSSRKPANGSTITGRGRRPAFESQGPSRPRSSALSGYMPAAFHLRNTSAINRLRSKPAPCDSIHSESAMIPARND